MTKKSTNKIKKALKDLPTLETSDDFIDRLHDKIIAEDRPEWDEVDFGNDGSVHIGNGIYAYASTWKVWMGLLWLILSMPLYLGIINSIAKYETNTYGENYDLVPAPIEDDEVIPSIFQAPVDSTSAGELESIMKLKSEIHLPTSSVETIEEWFSDMPFIWEKAETFDKAFSLARSYLGPNETFMWHGNEYHTLFVEEVVLYNN